MKIYKLLISKRDYKFGDGYIASLAIESGSIDILDYECKKGFQLDESLLKKAVSCGSLKIVKYILGVLGKYSDIKITSISVSNNRIDILLELIKYGIVLDKRTIESAAIYGKLDILLLFYSLGHTLERAPNWFFIYDEITKINIHKFYHYINLPGNYQLLCRQNVCKICHAFEISKLWQLESYEYNSYIQFLPRELIVDLEELILSK